METLNNKFTSEVAMAIEFMRTLKNAGYSVTRIGLNFKVVNPTTGLAQIMNISELEATATKTTQIIL